MQGIWKGEPGHLQVEKHKLYLEDAEWNNFV